MVSLDHGTPLFKEYVLERSYSSSVDYGKNSLKKKRWEVKIKISQYTLRKLEWTIIITNVRTLTRKITLEDQNSGAIHVMKEDTLQEIVLETKIDLSRRRETRKYIMLMLQKMMSLQRTESNKTVMILQVMKICFDFLSHGKYHTWKQ